jgi:hypothetical protein
MQPVRSKTFWKNSEVEFLGAQGYEECCGESDHTTYIGKGSFAKRRDELLQAIPQQK